MEPYMISVLSVSCFNKSKMFPTLLFTLLYYLILQLYIFSALYCCPPLFSKKPCENKSLNKGIIMLSCTTLRFLTLSLPSPDSAYIYIFFYFRFLTMEFYCLSSFPRILLQYCQQQNMASWENLLNHNKWWCWIKKEILFQEKSFQVLKVQGKIISLQNIHSVFVQHASRTYTLQQL